jgi:hypothetical protein
MQIDFQGLGFPLTAALGEHNERRPRFAITRCIDQISRVVVRLGDTNGLRADNQRNLRNTSDGRVRPESVK